MPSRRSSSKEGACSSSSRGTEEASSGCNRTPSAVASGREVEGPRNISVVAKARVAASEMVF